jgi:hypothetical protein
VQAALVGREGAVGGALLGGRHREEPHGPEGVQPLARGGRLRLQACRDGLQAALDVGEIHVLVALHARVDLHRNPFRATEKGP